MDLSVCAKDLFVEATQASEPCGRQYLRSAICACWVISRNPDIEPKLIQGVTFTDGIEVAVNPASSRSQTAAA